MAGACRMMLELMGACMVVLIGALVVLAEPVCEEGCPDPAYAYPFQSVCTEPAEFDVEYHLVAPFSNALVAKGGFTFGFKPSVTFTGNQSDEGLKFKLTALSSSASQNITLNTAFTITNTETQKKLGWLFSPWHRATVLSFVDDSSATEFSLARACNVPLPCPETTGARCESYFFLTPGGVGLTSVGNNHAGHAFSWIVRSGSESSGNLPLLLRRVDV